MTDGFQRGIAAEVLTGVSVTVVLALLLDGACVVAGRVLAPWTLAVRSPGGGAPGRPTVERHLAVPAEARA